MERLTDSTSFPTFLYKEDIKMDTKFLPEEKQSSDITKDSKASEVKLSEIISISSEIMDCNLLSLTIPGMEKLKSNLKVLSAKIADETKIGKDLKQQSIEIFKDAIDKINESEELGNKLLGKNQINRSDTK